MMAASVRESVGCGIGSDDAPSGSTRGGSAGSRRGGIHTNPNRYPQPLSRIRTGGDEDNAQLSTQHHATSHRFLPPPGIAPLLKLQSKCSQIPPNFHSSSRSL
eukprot:CAMPEP_0174896040 /NCGR_PEP_ID=MMETSP0167-20121228/10298_1 /TAXON_ID=38298 /ORGANISM="Rhodella maculata, Strain CCMP736" /LENGTH=102 /DNA_ID=CAMNT_0016135489 /DNA_START=189 /DNA_END=494 /DNA_ORIENTATION=+